MANLQPPESRIPDAWSIKLTFSLIVTFYLTEPKSRTKKSQRQFLYYLFDLQYYFCQKILIFAKRAESEKLWRSWY